MDKIKDLIEYSSETGSLDFKREQYPIDKKNSKKHEILKDIMAMANNFLYDECFIIVGVYERDSGEKEIFPIDKYHDDSIYQQFVSSNIEPKINFEYRQYVYDSKKIAYFRIFNNDDKPYLLSKEVKIKESLYQRGCGFIRRGTATEIIGRKELDRIYELKYSAQDRSDSIKILFGNEQSNDSLTDRVVLNGKDYLLNIFVQNTGNKSVTIHDIEAEIYKSNGLEVLNYFDLKVAESQKEFRKKEKERNYGNFLVRPSSFSSFMSNATSLGMRECDLVDNGKYWKLTLFLHKESYRIAQKDKEKLLGGILLKSNDGFEGSRIKIIIRSDDFKEPFVEEYEITAF